MVKNRMEEHHDEKYQDHRITKRSARAKLLNIVDHGTFCEFDKNMRSVNPLQFDGYNEKLENAIKNSGENEAIISGIAKVGNIPCVVFISDIHFMMGSMGSVVGEKVTRAFESAIRKKLPVISFSASGGARMQEGVLSLMQMAKTAGAVYRHNKKHLLYISVICDSTLGGVTASYASLADIIICENNAQFGFTGKRIIENTIKTVLPEDFQSAAYAQKRGQADLIVNTEDLRSKLISLLSIHYSRGIQFDRY